MEEVHISIHWANANPPRRLISVLLLDYMPYFEFRMINYALWNCTNYLTEQLPAWLYASLQN